MAARALTAALICLVLPSAADVPLRGAPGAKVVPNPKVYVIFWGDGVSPGGDLGAFYAAATNSSWMDWMAGDRAGIGRGTYAGSYTFGDPAVSCSGTSDADPLTVDQIADELEARLGSGFLPAPDENSIYMFHFPGGCRISDGSGLSCAAFCAFHRSYSRPADGHIVHFAVIPDLAHDGCESRCGSGIAFETLCSAASRELAEVVTSTAVGDRCDQRTSTIRLVDDAGNPSFAVQQLSCVSQPIEADDFKISFQPNLASITAGAATIALPLTLATTHGRSQVVTLSVAAPAGVTATFDAGQTSFTSDATTQLHLSAARGTAALKDGVLVVTASSATKAAAHSASVLLQIKTGAGGNDFALSLPAGTTALPAGQSALVTVTTSVVSGSAETISLSISGLPAGVTGSFAPASVTAGNTSTLTLTAAAENQELSS